MRNLVKEYIKLGKTFDDLKSEFGISSSVFDNLMCLSYSQIDSPKTASIVRQCRGLVIDKNTFDIVHYPFYRFYNFEEVLEERQKFNWKKSFALEKIDGSLCGCFFYNGKWYISSRSQIGGNNSLSSLITFGEIFDKALGMSRVDFFSKLDKSIDYTFELVSPLNIIVTPYSETKLYLIGARDKNNNFNEINIEKINISNLPIELPKKFSLIDENGNFRGFEEMKNMANSLPNSTDEGFVVVDYSNYDNEFGYYPRIKVKNNAYVALHHLRGNIENGSLNYGSILEIIWKNEQAEVLSNFPHFKKYFDEVENKYHNFLNEVNKVINDLSYYFNLPMDKREDKEIKKAFALRNRNKFSSLLFLMFNKGLTFKEVIKKINLTKKNYFKELWENYVSKF